jgi:hypothetical protein
MATVTVELDDRTFAELEARARLQRVSVEQLVAAAARAHAETEELVSDEFKALTERLIQEYRDVFSRLAQ